LDLSDPLSILSIIDTYCLRSREYSYLFDLNFTEIFDVSMLPNFSFSTALAKFYCEKHDTDVGKFKLLTSQELLTNALLLFPMVLPQLASKISVNSINSKAPDGSRRDLLLHPFFLETKATEYLNRLVLLYIERNSNLWKDPNAVDFLKATAAKVIELVEKDDPMVKNCQLLRESKYNEESESVNRHILLSDYTEALDTLPEDMVRQGMRIYDNNGTPNYENQQNQQQNIINNNPLSLFLRSLFPFDTNIPQGWVDNLMNWLGEEEGNENNENNENDDNNEEN